MRHVEPFVGGGALFFARIPKRALLTDINPALVATYAAIRNDVHSVIEGLRRLAGRHSKESYYRVRERYNEAVRRVARATRTPLVDLDAAFEDGGKERLFDDPAGDVIHPNRQGYALIAELLRQAVLQVTAGR